jgi:transmembrane protein 132
VDNALKICVVARVEEVFSWLLEVVEDSSDLWDGGRIVWSVRYALEGAESRTSFVRGGVNIRQMHGGHSHHGGSGGGRSGAQHRPLRDGLLEETRRKLTARLEIQKDDIQSVLPISKVRKIFYIYIYIYMCVYLFINNCNCAYVQ